MQAILTHFHRPESSPADFWEKASNFGLGLLRLSAGTSVEVSDETFTELSQACLINRIFFGIISLTILLPLTIIGAVSLLGSTTHGEILQDYIQSLAPPPRTPPITPRGLEIQKKAEFLAALPSALDTFFADDGRLTTAMTARGTLNLRLTEEERALGNSIYLYMGTDISNEQLPRAITALYFINPAQFRNVLRLLSQDQLAFLASATSPLVLEQQPVLMGDFLIEFLDQYDSVNEETQQKIQTFINKADPNWVVERLPEDSWVWKSAPLSWVVSKFPPQQWNWGFEARATTMNQGALLNEIINAMKLRYKNSEGGTEAFEAFFSELTDSAQEAVFRLRSLEGAPLLMDNEEGAIPYLLGALKICENNPRMIANAHRDLSNPLQFFQDIDGTLDGDQRSDVISSIVKILMPNESRLESKGHTKGKSSTTSTSTSYKRSNGNRRKKRR